MCRDTDIARTSESSFRGTFRNARRVKGTRRRRRPRRGTLRSKRGRRATRSTGGCRFQRASRCVTPAIALIEMKCSSDQSQRRALRIWPPRGEPSSALSPPRLRPLWSSQAPPPLNENALNAGSLERLNGEKKKTMTFLCFSYQSRIVEGVWRDQFPHIHIDIK